jgi:pentatricopeptide repeat protein
MEQNKSPFEEIFKREEKQKKSEEKEEGILDALDREEKSLFEESAGEETIILEGDEEQEGGVSAEIRYQKLLNSLVKKRFFEEAIRVIGEMKKEFGEQQK